MNSLHRRMWAAVALVLAQSAPAAADGFEPDADMGYAFEFQNWSVPASTGRFGFNAAMHTVTLTDRTGVVLALASSASKTRANEYYARQDAARRQEQFYQYQVAIDEPKEGVRLSLVLGTGSPSGLYGPALTTQQDLDAKLARLRFETDLFGLGGGVGHLVARALEPQSEVGPELGIRVDE